MIITHHREKLINAIIYFCQETSLCNKVKLFKLLYHLDFEHFAQTGRSVTGLQYYAWPKGPVPVELQQEIEEPKPDMAEKVSFEPQYFKNGGFSLNINPKAEFDSSSFSKRELALLKEIADRYALMKADEMIDSTHLPAHPWDRVYRIEKRKNQAIPYEYAVTASADHEILQAAKEHQEMLAHYA